MEFLDSSYFQLLLIAGGGLFSIAGAVFNWDWFMNNDRAQPFVNFFGREGARVFYVVLGLVLIVLGVVIFLQS
jgi:small neutral amino acid transporter SnatA (MarC family)